jgi:alpha-ribazole phosphatase
MPELFLVRHAEPELTGVLLGHCDPALSAAGREHASELLAGVELARVYTSPLRRAVETAELIARRAPIEVLDELSDITFGAWDGMTWAEVEKIDPEFAARKLRDWRGVTLPGAEAWSDFAQRVEKAFETIRNGPRPAAVVAHAAVHHVIAQVDLVYGGVHEL